MSVGSKLNKQGTLSLQLHILGSCSHCLNSQGGAAAKHFGRAFILHVPDLE